MSFYFITFNPIVCFTHSFLSLQVCDAKPLVRKSLIDAGHAISYSEPESLVISRSGEFGVCFDVLCCVCGDQTPFCKDYLI